MRILYIILLSMGGLWASSCHAQSTTELIEELVLDFQKLQDMKSILQDMYKGYEILDKGYTEISDLAKGQFNLHKAFLDGLLAVSPAVKNYYRVAAIVSAEYALVKEYKTAGPADAGRIASTLYHRSLRAIDELTMALTDGAMRMSDAERMQTIDRVYIQIRDELSAMRTLNQELTLQALQRQREQNTINLLKQFYDNH